MLCRTTKQYEPADSQLQCLLNALALAFVASGGIPAHSRVEELGDLAHTGVRLPRTRSPRAPVAEGTFPGRFIKCKYPSNAKATASFASPSK